MERTEYRVEIQNTDEEWHLASPVAPGQDPLHSRDEVVRVMRDFGGMNGRYVAARLLKTVTATEVVGEVIRI